MCNIGERKTDYYIRDKDDLTNFENDQTVIVKEHHLKHITGINIFQESRTGCPPLEQWYPYCNSYYPYAEDVDPIERVNHILGSKPSLPSLYSLEAISELTEGFAYTEKSAQLRYLESNPVSFLILGKPSIGEDELGQHLADYWQCVYIEPKLLIEQEIESDTRAGQCIEFNLRCGRAIGIDVILKLVEKRVNSETAKHRGFLLCGLPLIPNDLYEDDPISSESAIFTVKEMFEEVIDTVMEIGKPPSSRHEVTISSKYTSEVEEPGEGDEDDRVQPVEVAEVGEGGATSVKEHLPTKSPTHDPVDLGADYNVCQSPEIGVNFEHQLRFLFDLLKAPFIIIYIMCSTEDVINKRFNYRYDVHSNVNVDLLNEKNRRLLNDLFSREQGKNNEEIPEEFFDSVFYDSDVSKLNNLVLLPRHFPAHVSTQLDHYRTSAMDFIETRILLHDPQYFLKVDGRTSVQRMFHLVKARLKILPLQKVLVPRRFSGSEHDADASAEGEITPFSSNGMTFEDCYRIFSKKETPSVTFKWRWSDWGTKCPVSMRDGKCRNGQPDYAVHFMNKIFFLSDEQAFLKFHRNPRPFLLPPFPKPACKIFIYGPKSSGKTAVAKCLAYFLNGTVLSIDHMMKDFLMQKGDELKEQIRQAAFIEGIGVLNEMRKNDAEKQEQDRVDQIKDWAFTVKDTVQNLIQLIDEKEREQTVTKFEISSFPMAMKKVDLVEIETETTIAIKKARDELESYKIPFSYDVNVLKNMLRDKRNLFSYLPDHLKRKVRPKPATVLDEFVIDFANKAVENADLDHIDINKKNVVDMFISTIREVEDTYIEQGNNRGGWILDGMISEPAILNELFPEYIADEIIVLKDSGNYDFLTERFSERGENTFMTYREFFMDLGYIDAAWRAPSEISTASYKTNLARRVLSEVLEDTLQSVSARSESYRKEVSIFYDEWSHTNEYFQQLGCKPLEIQVTNKSLPDLMKECIRIIQDRYQVTASPFSEEDRAEEVKHFGDETIREEEVAEGPSTAVHSDENLIEKNRRYGETFHYCPVTLKDCWVLWKGKEDLAVKFQDQVYLLSCESDMNKFLLSPRTYLTDLPPKRIPPPRICVVGIQGSGKTTISKHLAVNYGLSYISFSSILKKAFNMDSSLNLDELKRNEGTNKDLFNYLNYNNSLKEDFYVNNMSKLWFSHPTNRTGLIIDDFPKRPSDIEFMVKYRLIPDLVMHLEGDETEIKNRSLDIHSRKRQEQMEIKWRQLAEHFEEEMAEWEEKRQKRFKELLEERREQRYTEKKGDRSTSSRNEDNKDLTAISQVSFDSIAEQQDIDDINRMLDVEIPEISPIQQDILEEDNYEVLLSEDVTMESRFLKDIQAACDLELIPFTKIEIDIRHPDLTSRRALFITDSVKHRNLSIFERCYDVSMEIADRLLSCGYYFLSKFGKTCPIQYYENKNPFPTFRTAEERYNIFPVIHRSYIYFIIGESKANEFKKDPLKFVTVDKVDLTLRPFKISIIGPPKCGKTTLAERIKNEYGMRMITRGQAVRNVLSQLPYSILSEKMESLLRGGQELTDDLVAKCVEAATMDARAITQGVVYDGFPNTLGEVKFLSYLGLVPNLVIDLHASEDEVLECLSGDVGRRGFPLYSQHFVKHLFNMWAEKSSSFREWFDKEYQVTSEIPIGTSNWSVCKQTRDLMEAVYFEIQHYCSHAGKDWPVRLANMQITPLEFLERQSSYKHFCPCCIHVSNELCSGGEPPDRTGLVQWRYFYYSLCPSHIELFLSTPEAYLPPFNRHTLPLDLPSRQTLKSVPEDLFEDGNCLVCYRNLRVLTMGSIDLSVRYRNRTYLFNSEDCLREFVRQPWTFPVEISFRPPPARYSSLGYRELPILGMLEQYVSAPVIKALSYIARRRPVIPGLSVSASAAVGIGLFLKVYNENMSSELRLVYARGDKAYRERMEKLINYLDRMKSVINPYLYYEEPLPGFAVLESVKSVSTESVGTAISKIVDEVVGDAIYDA